MERGGYPNLSIANPNSAAGDHQAKATRSNGNTAAAEESECTVREQDRFMPIANVIRIMRKILPSHAKISDDAKETIQECVSEYISFITGEANERCQREQRKTITAEDVLWAMSKLGFDDYIEPLTLFLHRYREFEGDRGSSAASASSIMRGGADSFKPTRNEYDHHRRAVEYAQPPHMGFAPFYHHHHAFFSDAPPMGFFKELGSNGNVGPSSHHADLGNGGDAIGPLGK